MAGLPLGYTIRVASNGVLNPSSSKISQKWQRQQFGSISWSDTGGTGTTYTVTNTDRNCKVRVAQLFASGQELYSNELQVDNFPPPFEWEMQDPDLLKFQASRVAYDRDSGVFVIAGKRGDWCQTDRSKRKVYDWKFPAVKPSGWATCNAAWYLNATDEVVMTNMKNSDHSVVYANLTNYEEKLHLPYGDRPFGYGPLNEGAYDFIINFIGQGYYGTRSQVPWTNTGQEIAELSPVETIGQYLDSTHNIFGVSGKYVYKFTGISSGLIQYDKRLMPFVGTHNKFLNSIAYHNRKWVAVGGSTHLFTSSNWTSWRANNSIIAAFPNNTNISGVCYAANKWWCTGYKLGKVVLASSTDAENWTLEDLPDGLPESGVSGADYFQANGPRMAGYGDEAIWVIQYDPTSRVCKLAV